MKKFIFIDSCLLFAFFSFAQTVNQKFQKAFQQFEKDAQLQHAISSLYVIDAKTGKVVFDKNSQIGLAPASTQKIITSVTAFELLGKDYRYKTEFGIRKGNSDILYIKPSGDPTFGSWRWKQTDVKKILDAVIYELKRSNIQNIMVVWPDDSNWDFESIPDGWIWQDIGNFYGAGAIKFNCRENQIDIILRSGKRVGDSVKTVAIKPDAAWLFGTQLESKLIAAKKNAGDNAYVYFPSDGIGHFKIRGSIPINEDSFRISAVATGPEWLFLGPLTDTLILEKMWKEGKSSLSDEEKILPDKVDFQNIYRHASPSLDSIIYWFNKKSINLYGEALIKTFAYEKKGFGSTDSGVLIVKDFWKEKGLDQNELNIGDGSGLSPQNRVTTHAQVEILKYARTRDWFPYFYNSLPEYNGMTMKSGTIKDVKGFCGYHKAKNGVEYIFSFLVNNYNGPSSGLINKMYKVLDVLK